MNNNILEKEELCQIASKCRQQGQIIVATNGCFDILHVGHLHLLNQAKAMGDVLIVGINSDKSVSKLKGAERPIVSENDRAQVIANLKAVDYVSIFEEDTAVEFLQTVKPHIYVKGGDYQLNTLPEAVPVTAAGGQVKFVEFLPRKSSSGLIEIIKTLS